MGGYKNIHRCLLILAKGKSGKINQKLRRLLTYREGGNGVGRKENGGKIAGLRKEWQFVSLSSCTALTLRIIVVFCLLYLKSNKQ